MLFSNRFFSKVLPALVLIGTCAPLLLVACRPAAAQYATLSLQSQTGDYIGKGSNYVFTFTPANTVGTGGYFNHVLTGSSDPTGESEVRFNFLQSPPSGTVYGDAHSSQLVFSTDFMNVKLAPGTYTNAQSLFSNAVAMGYPALYVTVGGRNAYATTGSFTISQISFIPSAGSSHGYDIGSMDATFEQHSDRATAALFGQFSYRSTGTPSGPAAVPEPSSLAPFAFGGLGLTGLIVRVLRRRKSTAD